ncbi:XkdQ/YqbQ family protein [Bacillus wiedmannii]
MLIGKMDVTDAVIPPIQFDDDYESGPVKVEISLVSLKEFKDLDGKPLQIKVGKQVWFKGLIRAYQDANGKDVKITAYDHLFNLVKSDDEFAFQNRTATQIMREILDRYSYPVKEMVDINVVFPLMYLEKNNAESVYEMLIIVLHESKLRTGKKYWVRFEPEGLRVFEWTPPKLIPVLGPGITNVEKKVSSENIKNRIKVVNREKNIVAFQSDGDSIRKYGPLSTVEEYGAETEAAAQSRADSMLKVQGLPDVSRSIEHVHSLEEQRFWSGDYIYLEDPTETILGGYYIRKVTYDVYKNRVVFKADLVKTAALPNKAYVPPEETQKDEG